MGPRLTFLAALAACAACDRVPQEAIESCQAQVRVLPAKTDILVVVDDSGSMAEEQENLRENLGVFVTALAASPVPHDFQIGVTTTDVVDFDGFTVDYPWWLEPYLDYPYTVPYPRGALVAVDPAARTDASKVGKILYDPTNGFGGTRILVTSSSTLVPDFEANVLLGTLGSSKEQPFRSVELALTERVADAANAGFLRPGARLGLIVLTDEDDCSEWTLPFLGDSNDHCHDPAIKAQLPSPSAFLDFLDGEIAGEERSPVVAVIAGFDQETLAPTGCATSFDAPTRLASLLDAMGPDRSFRGSICDQSFGPSLERIAELLVPQTVPLDGAPSDSRMLVVAVDKAGGGRIACTIVADGDPASAQAGAVYTPPRGGRPATLTFQNACRLAAGDHVELSIVCAR
ncbi:MAG TPA: hypothetical protein VFG59_06760 [Anaeromyxobacter sp.]|nr:hypothetical protein [Anaeromyxobacter sp.]